MKLISGKNLKYKYKKIDEQGETSYVTALHGIDIDIEQGQIVAILGHNGSGKSTLAKQLNALLVPSEGDLLIEGDNTKNTGFLWKIREKIGMVFQNPDNQMIANIVEEDVAFGPENLGVPTEEILDRVHQALNAVHMQKYRMKSPMKLSGGQKQRIAIAGILAMRSKCIVLDEPTAMLDPRGRKEVLDSLKQLNQKENITIILITHHMDEVLLADLVYVMNQGRVVMKGSPKEIFSNKEKVKEYGLELPVVTEVAYRLQQEGIPLPDGIITMEELMNELKIRKC